MDESALQTRLRRIEQRQYLILALLVIPYLLGVAELIGFWIASVLGVGFALVGFAFVALSRRRRRDAVGE